MKSGKGQAAIEYLMVFGLALLLSTPFILRAQSSIFELQSSAGVVQLQNSLEKTESAIETVSASGEPAQRTFTVDLPEAVESGVIVNNSIVYTIRTSSGKSQLIRGFETNLTGSLPQTPGRHRVTVYMKNGEANIEVVN
ncbi:MAG: hypothetical protein ABEI58_01890 [Candidatus Nanohaloarchaea archaeon]